MARAASDAGRFRARRWDHSEPWDASRVPAGRRLAVEGYVKFRRPRSVLDRVAASLTELSASLTRVRTVAFERHHPWTEADGLTYFRTRVGQGARDGEEALAPVQAWAHTGQQQERAVMTLAFTCDVPWVPRLAVDRGGVGQCRGGAHRPLGHV